MTDDKKHYKNWLQPDTTMLRIRLHKKGGNTVVTVQLFREGKWHPAGQQAGKPDAVHETAIRLWFRSVGIPPDLPIFSGASRQKVFQVSSLVSADTQEGL